MGKISAIEATIVKGITEMLRDITYRSSVEHIGSEDEHRNIQGHTWITKIGMEWVKVTAEIVKTEGG